jgi:hypothetical protein
MAMDVEHFRAPSLMKENVVQNTVPTKTAMKTAGKSGKGKKRVQINEDHVHLSAASLMSI